MTVLDAVLVLARAAEGGAFDEVAARHDAAEKGTDEEARALHAALFVAEDLLGRRATFEELVKARVDLPAGSVRRVILEAAYFRLELDRSPR